MIEWDNVNLSFDTPEWDSHSNTFHGQEINTFQNSYIGNMGPITFLTCLSITLQGLATTVLNMRSNTSPVLADVFPIPNDDMGLLYICPNNKVLNAYQWNTFIFAKPGHNDQCVWDGIPIYINTYREFRWE